MDRFVIQYSTGSYDSYTEHVRTLEAESKEAIIDAINEAIVGFVAHNNRVKDFMETSPVNLRREKYNHPALVQWHKDWNEFVKEHGALLYDLDVFGGSLCVETTNGTTIAELFPGFEIYELDEWFEERKIEND